MKITGQSFGRKDAQAVVAAVVIDSGHAVWRRATVMATLAIAANLAGCGSDPSSSRCCQLDAGWVTNCAGPAFRPFAANGGSGPGPERPVFRINDQLVLAVPKQNRPYASSIDHEPSECRNISDLPRARFLHFVIQGNWSAGFRPEDIPLEDGHRKFDPDYVTVRIEPATPITASAEDTKKSLDEMEKWHRDHSSGTLDIGGLTCFIPKGGYDFFDCAGSRSKSDPDVIKLRYKAYSAPNFVLVQAQYVSSHYGGLRVFWQAWTADPPVHARDIDAAVWQAIEDWNVLSRVERHAAPL